jgi:AcrR family transcriptional regulator
MKKQNLPDRRIQRTRQLLLDALIELILEKGYEAVIVQDIIDRANVGRSTFYSHFQDKEELLLSGFENMRTLFEAFYSQTSQEITGWNFTLALFKHAEDKRTAFKALVGKKAGDVVINHVKKALNAVLKEHFQAAFAKKDQPIPLDLFVEYMVNTFLGCLTWWLDNDIAYTAEKMNDYFRTLTEPTIRTLVGS